MSKRTTLDRHPVVYVPFTEFNWWCISNNVCNYEETYIPHIFDRAIPYLEGTVTDVVSDNEDLMYTIEFKKLEGTPKTIAPNTSYMIYETYEVYKERLDNPSKAFRFQRDPNMVLVTSWKDFQDKCESIYRHFLEDRDNPYTIHDLTEDVSPSLQLTLHRILKNKTTFDAYWKRVESRTNAKLVMQTLSAEITKRFAAGTAPTFKMPVSVFRGGKEGYVHGTIDSGVYETNVVVRIHYGRQSHRIPIPPTLFRIASEWVDKVSDDVLENNDVAGLAALLTNASKLKPQEASQAFLEVYNVLFEPRVWYWWSPVPNTIKHECTSGFLVNRHTKVVLYNRETNEAYIPLDMIQWWEASAPEDNYNTLKTQAKYIHSGPYHYIIGNASPTTQHVSIPLLKYTKETVRLQPLENENQRMDIEKRTIFTESQYFHYQYGYIYYIGIEYYQNNKFKGVKWNRDIVDEVEEFEIFLDAAEMYPEILMKLDIDFCQSMYDVIYNTSISLGELDTIFQYMLLHTYESDDILRYTTNYCLRELLAHKDFKLVKQASPRSSIVMSIQDWHQECLSKEMQYQKKYRPCFEVYKSAIHHVIREKDFVEREMIRVQASKLAQTIEEQTLQKSQEWNVVFPVKLLNGILKEEAENKTYAKIYRFNGTTFKELVIDGIYNNHKKVYYMNERELFFHMFPDSRPSTIDDMLKKYTTGIQNDPMLPIEIPLHVHLYINHLLSVADTIHDFGSGTRTRQFIKTQINVALEYVKDVLAWKNLALDKDTRVNVSNWVQGYDTSFERNLLTFFDTVYLQTGAPLEDDILNMSSFLVPATRETTKRKRDNGAVDYAQIAQAINRLKQYRRIRVCLGSNRKDQSASEKQKKTPNRDQDTGIYTMDVTEQAKVIGFLVRTFIGPSYSHYMVNMTTLSTDMFTELASSTASVFDRGEYKRHALDMLGIDYNIHRNENELFFVDTMYVNKLDNNLYMEKDQHEKNNIKIRNNDCRPKKDLFAELLDIKEKKLVYTYRDNNARSIVEHCFPMIQDNESILLDIKRTGDMLSSKSVASWNENQPTHVVFVTGDFLAALKARLVGCPVICTYIDSKTRERYMDIYRPLDIRVQSPHKGGTTLDPVRTVRSIRASFRQGLERTIPRTPRIPEKSASRLHKSLVPEASSRTVGLTVRAMQTMPSTRAPPLQLTHAASTQHTQYTLVLWAFAKLRPGKARRLVQHAHDIQYLADTWKDAHYVLRPMATELMMRKMRIELFQMPLQKAFEEALWMHVKVTPTAEVADAIESLGYMFKWDDPNKVYRAAQMFLRSVKRGGHGPSPDWYAYGTKLLEKHRISDTDVLYMKYIESGTHEFMQHEPIDYMELLEHGLL